MRNNKNRCSSLREGNDIMLSNKVCNALERKLTKNSLIIAVLIKL